ncbi:MAG: crossover junction endodeoxyribonuclease RuvC [Thiotrichales bacterium]|nr:MAG: crossover junction endodeoxyribonuclease RuvC [Thiotrichales bacterium]
MIRIIGIDPGSRITGYGVLDTDGFRHQYVSSGFIRIKADTLGDKLGIIYTEVGKIVAAWKPESMAIEQVFVKNNVDSALKLGQARGAAICAAVQANLPLGEYTPRAIKKAVVGSGAADKQQIQLMVQRLLGLEELPQSDEADALAIAICHAHHVKIRSTGRVRGVRRGRWV